jgi:lipopolysaccharide/colanic/teichoic acid biosynthesis glycosyltransferase
MSVTEASADSIIFAEQSAAFRISKRIFDIVFSFFLLPFVIITALCLALLNLFMNRGPLIYAQPRMGRGCRAFAAYKFRSMLPTDRISRAADDPLETHRITPLGQFLRKSRLDELPQVINVLRGDMSLIGPRPDYFHHARRYLRDVPGYRARHAVRPGISGLAQTQLGYAQGLDATVEKTRADLYYIRNSSLLLEAWIFWRTLVTVFGRRGA